MRLVYFLDLINDPVLIEAYEEWHRNVWPEIEATFLTSGILVIEIFRAGDRLVLIMETSTGFSEVEKSIQDAANPIVQEWETLMWKFQKPLPFALPGSKWVKAEKIYSWYK